MSDSQSVFSVQNLDFYYGPSKALSNISVITSYSIHYTKLYENYTLCVVPNPIKFHVNFCFRNFLEPFFQFLYAKNTICTGILNFEFIATNNKYAAFLFFNYGNFYIITIVLVF